MSFSAHTISGTLRLSALGSLRIASMAALIGLAACSSKPQELRVQTVETEVRQPPVISPLPDPTPIRTLPFEWVVITQDTVPEGDFVLFGLTPEGYEALSLNSADTLRWVQEAMHRLRTYREALSK